MDYKQQITNKFYQTLGKLFYAVAMADKNVRPIEVAKLREAVRSNWLPVDDIEDEYGTDAAYQIEIVFDWLQAQEEDGGIYFEEFKTFYEEHPELFTRELASLIWKTADSIAFSFAGKNKSELILLAKLKMVLQEKY